MSNKSYDYLVFIGRFQPFHRAHQGVVRQALDRADYVILLLGSANSPRTLSNPWTVTEREAMIRSIYDETTNKRIIVRGIEDYPYDDAEWQHNVVQTVTEITGNNARVGLIGHMKDSSSYYLELFPDWGLVPVDNIDHISATDVRNAYFDLAENELFDYPDLHGNIVATLRNFRNTAAYNHLRTEYRYLQSWQERWSKAPYPPVFVTVDACVLCAGNVLMVERKSPPGAGLWALPGGFIEQNETLTEAALRELREETGLSYTASDIDRCEVFAHPDRSARGRTITHVHRIVLSGPDLPILHPGDDASKAKWVALSTLDPRTCFEDHYSIIRSFSEQK